MDENDSLLVGHTLVINTPKTTITQPTVNTTNTNNLSNIAIVNTGSRYSGGGTGSVTQIDTGAGLVGGPITTTGTIKAQLKSETLSNLASISMGDTNDRQYAVGLDKDGNLSVNIPWVDTNTTYSFTNGVALNGNVVSNSGVRAITTGTNNGTISVNTNGTLSDIAVKGLGNLAYLSSLSASDVGAVALTDKGIANGVAELDENGLILSSQLPSYVDDIVDGYYYEDKFYQDSSHTIEIIGEASKIYLDISTNQVYRWSGSTFVEIASSLALGETSSTAYRGDRGKIAYDHSQSAHAIVDATKVEASTTNGNIKINSTETTVYTHPTTTATAASAVKVGKDNLGHVIIGNALDKTDVGLENVGNFKAVSTVANQGLTDTEKANARDNIDAYIKPTTGIPKTDLESAVQTSLGLADTAMQGMTILSYGKSTWQDFLDAYTKQTVIYCRASSNSNPASGSQTRLAFMAYVNNADPASISNVEFQYYRSMSSHTDAQQGDQVYVYKLESTNGGKWTVTTRDAFTKIVNGDGIDKSFTTGVHSSITLSNAGVRAISSGDTNGTIKVNTGGTEADVSVTGLSDLAYLSLGSGSTKYLREDGTWQPVQGGGGTGTVTDVVAGAGLNTTGPDSSVDGGTIDTSGTLYLTKTAVTPGTYQGITVDKYGRVTSASDQSYTSLSFDSGDTTKYLRHDGTWVSPGSGATVTSWAWTNGTTSGPTATISGSGMSDVSVAAIPAANGTTTSGIVTTGAQTFGGVKTFNSAPVLSTNTLTTSGGYTITIPNSANTTVATTNTSQALTNKTYNGYTLNSACAASLITSSTGIAADVADCSDTAVPTEKAVRNLILYGSNEPVSSQGNSGSIYIQLA